MRLNHVICPNCKHDFYDGERVVFVCDACGHKFSIRESLTSRRPETIMDQQARFHRDLAARLGE